MHTVSRRLAAGMTAAGWVALALAIFGAFSYAAGSILQAVGAQRSTGTVRTLGHPLYLLGVACDLLAWAGSMVALRELAVYQVQSVLAGSLALTVIGARLILASRLRTRDVVAVVITIAALTVLAMSAGPQEEVAASSRLRLGFCVAALAAAVVGWGATKVASPGVVAALAGLCFGGAALSGRALALPEQPMEHPSAAGLAIVTEPLTAALFVFAATGMLLYTNALQHGQVGPVTAVLWIGEVVAPSAVGLALLGDTVRPGWELRAAVAGLVTVAAAVVLATAPATSATAQPSPARPAEVPRPAAPAMGRWPVAQPSWAYPVGSASSWYQPAEAQPPYDRRAGTMVWWGPPNNSRPLWIPPPRPALAWNLPIVAEPVVGYRYGAQPAWRNPAGPQPSWRLPVEAYQSGSSWDQTTAMQRSAGQPAGVQPWWARAGATQQFRGQPAAPQPTGAGPADRPWLGEQAQWA